ncbi:hypothetical protein [Streptomyces sp. NBC_01217]|nr:hypothetical protein OG507_01510 [Streptomyces sp. NBC_01217]
MRKVLLIDRHDQQTRHQTGHRGGPVLIAVPSLLARTGTTAGREG